ncbi:MAG: hypothetical protein J1E40_08835 [Oscillospiraceae bacterium]|nr:hypothetical protein [Oscillospiraceae bacterium]
MDLMEQEMVLRHKTCIFLALETLLLCALVILLFVLSDGSWTYLYFHEYALSETLLEVAAVCAVPVICTMLSMRFRIFYYVYEIFHGIVGVYFGGVFLSLFLLTRFFVYLFKLSKIKEG